MTNTKVLATLLVPFPGGQGHIQHLLLTALLQAQGKGPPDVRCLSTWPQVGKYIQETHGMGPHKLQQISPGHWISLMINRPGVAGAVLQTPLFLSE